MAVLFSSTAQAGVVIDGTRVIYPSNAREVNVRLTNQGTAPVLVQSWLDTGDENATPDKIVTPFILTPPINRVESGKGQSLRISAANVAALHQDRETVYWLNVLEIPAMPTGSVGDQNYLQLAVRTRIKLFYRPASLKGEANQAVQSLTWTRDAAGLTVRNPTPWHISLTRVTVGGKTTAADMVAPMGSNTFRSIQVARGSTVTANWVDDYGAHRKQDFTVN